MIVKILFFGVLHQTSAWNIVETTKRYTISTTTTRFTSNESDLSPRWPNVTKSLRRIPENTLICSSVATDSTLFATLLLTAAWKLNLLFAFFFCLLQHLHRRHFHRLSVLMSLCSFTMVAIALISHDPLADLFSLEIPSINVNLDSLLDEFRVIPCRRSFAAVSSPEGESVSEEEGQSTTLWPLSPPSSLPASPRLKPRPTWTPPLLVSDTTWATITDANCTTGAIKKQQNGFRSKRQWRNMEFGVLVSLRTILSVCVVGLVLFGCFYFCLIEAAVTIQMHIGSNSLTSEEPHTLYVLEDMDLRPSLLSLQGPRRLPCDTLRRCTIVAYSMQVYLCLILQCWNLICGLSLGHIGSFLFCNIYTLYRFSKVNTINNLGY